MKDAENKKTDEKVENDIARIYLHKCADTEEISMKRTWMNDKPCVIKASCVPHICEKVPEIRR
ncbi:hypothetical protein T4E_9272 [Trichinella pseudospiralis]|uniref:Uncharacterized protein n=1 Tax=Trichinella pseudospiralis TaxID=6337 RepID=A0A0V0XRH1_TRIPS|nr:hypothetical protein T4E_9272 [Trichinella pseudospiralis]